MEKAQEILEHWNAKKIVVHRKLTRDIASSVRKALKDYTTDEIKGYIDFYATIMEVDVPEGERKYFWTYKWGLSEFLTRGLKKFDGQELNNYQRRQKVETPEAVIIKRP